MQDLQVETHALLKDELPQALASHMLATCLDGSIAVVCEQPEHLMNQIKSQWSLLTQNRSTHYSENIRFSADSPFDDTQANVSLSTVKEFKLLPPICRTLYVTCKVDRKDMYMITSWMQPRAVVVIYNVK